jgi:ubiquinone/menaquinone biosynthesis C-methylase UbiE
MLKGRVLEVGIGAGPLTAKLLRVEGVQEIQGLDLAAPMLKTAQKRGASPTLGMGERIPFKNGSFDSALCLDTLGHVDKPATVLKEISRVLKPESHVMVNFMEKDLFSKLWGGRGEMRYKAHTEDEMARLISESGLELIEMKKARLLPFLPKMVFIRAQKPASRA